MSLNDERLEKLKALTDKLEAGVKEVFESEKYTAYLNAVSKFHDYSFGNVMLILMQCPEASFVAGFHSWKRNFGRTVKKGEHGIQILAPCEYKKLVTREKLDAATMQPILGPDGAPETETAFEKRQGFRIVYVYDLSQTEGREFPSLSVDELTGDIENFDRIFSAVESISPVPIEYREPQASKGCYNHLEQKIYINSGMSHVQTIKTAIHETAHALLHALPVKNGKIVGKPDKDQHTREVEAESVAYVVCQHFGIDTSDYSFAYVTSWSSGKELDELKSSLECIRTTAAAMIDGIEQSCPELDRNPKPERNDRDGNVSHGETHFSEK